MVTPKVHIFKYDRILIENRNTYMQPDSARIIANETVRGDASPLAWVVVHSPVPVVVFYSNTSCLQEYGIHLSGKKNVYMARGQCHTKTGLIYFLRIGAE